MGQHTAIEWCHHTLNIFRGCAKVHAGCTNCYAEKNVGVKMQGITWGEVWQGGQRVVMAESGWAAPMKWARDAARAGERRRVFCSSLADVLEVPAEPPPSLSPAAYHSALARVQLTRLDLDRAREHLWDVIRQTARWCFGCEGTGRFRGPGGDRPCPHLDNPIPEKTWDGTIAPGLDWLLLTKRPENWRLVPEDMRPLVWLGTSISDQKTALEWGGRLRDAVGFRLKFYSLEPMVGPVEHLPLDGISWVIVGGESGSKARPLNVAWVRSIVEQCRAAGVPCFVKQVGARPTGLGGHGDVAEHMDPKGGDMEQWPPDIRVRELPAVPR